MCEIIVLKRKKINKDILLKKLNDSVTFNPHGAGIAFFFKNKLYFFKSVRSNSIISFLKESYNNIDLPIVIHTRLATSGSVNSSNCHPFDLENPYKISGKSTALLFHNGIVDDYLLDLLNVGLEIEKHEDDSDTRFLAKILSKLNDNYKDKILNIIATHTYSKFVLLTPTKLATYGTFYYDQAGFFTSVKQFQVHNFNRWFGTHIW